MSVGENEPALPSVQLGFVEQPHEDDEPLSIKFFPTKLGGKPYWLDPAKPMAPERLACKNCNEPMILLMQIYTAEEFPAEAFHRYLYVYVCRKGSCHKGDYRKCTRVFRAQMAHDNPYFAYFETDAETEETELKDAYKEKAAHQCVVCGALAGKRCSGCRSVWYCSREHQQAHWSTGLHKEHCKVLVEGGELEEQAVAEDLARLVRLRWQYPELEVVSEPEELTDKMAPGSLVKLPPKPVEDEEYEESETGVDKAFLRFQKRLERYPGQVLRYLRVSDEVPPVSLLVSDLGKPVPSDVPACPRCGAARTLECQLLPTLLSYLPLDLNNPSSYDFGTYFVYSCPDNCELTGEIVEEVILRQDYSSDGMAPVKDRLEKVQAGLQEQGIDVEV
ncbi:hypothetical protein H9P43_010078 [Blastocladiella emersonii ATCC 22665]|nr:hypothetical protein H9P43_010078 [Blastocladiella emersonii ATCC 22665]